MELLWIVSCDQDFSFEHFDAVNQARLAEISGIEERPDLYVEESSALILTVG